MGKQIVKDSIKKHVTSELVKYLYEYYAFQSNSYLTVWELILAGIFEIGNLFIFYFCKSLILRIMNKTTMISIKYSLKWYTKIQGICKTNYLFYSDFS